MSKPSFTKEQKEYLRDFINNKLVAIQYCLDENIVTTTKEAIVADKNVTIITKFLKELEVKDTPIDTCPHCGCNEMLCGYPGRCTSINNQDNQE